MKTDLSGGIPEALFNMSSLQVLDLERNMLGEALPPNIGDAPNLRQLHLAFNMFEGHITASLGNDSALEWIDLLSGQVPTSFGKLQHLSYLFFSLSDPY